MKRRIWLLVSISIVLLSAAFIVNSKVKQSSATTNEIKISVEPLNLFCDHIIDSLGDVFTVRVYITDVPSDTGLYGVEFKVFFDSTILRCTEADYPPDYVFANMYNIEVPPEIDNIEGCVSLAAALIGDQCWRLGDGVLVQMNFTAIREGVSPLSLQDVILLDYDLVEYDFTPIDSFVDVGSQLPWIYSDDTKKGGNYSLVAIEPAYTTFAFSYPNRIEFTVSVNDTEQCNVAIPHLETSGGMTVWDGPFKVRTDENRVNHTVSFNATHTFLSFSCDGGVHDIEVNEATVMCISGDLDEDGYIGIKDMFIIAKNFGKQCETP